MLFTETVDAETLALIDALMMVSDLDSFRLVGGTALALQIGHRSSTDIDLFTIESGFDFERLQQILADEFSLEVKAVNRIGLFCYINGVKTDFVRNHSIWLDPPMNMEGIRMASVKEIAAMKIGAICGRGRKRDFFDLHEILHHFTMKEILEFYHFKFPNSDETIPIRSLIYFEDAEEDNILKSKQNFNWDMIKKRITDEVKKL